MFRYQRGEEIREVSAQPPANRATLLGSARQSLALHCVLVLLALPASVAAQEGSAHIVNGTLTSSFASTGALLIHDDATQTHLTGLCSGTLVGCRTVVTAAHCVCSGVETAAECARSGLVGPERLAMFFQHAGFAPVAAVAISPDYVFGEAGDLAVLQLEQPVAGIDPTPLNRVSKPAIGGGGTIVGFGRSLNDATVRSDAGIKRAGNVTVADCNGVVPNETHVCWQFLGSESSTCSGDSGGPLFTDFGDGTMMLAGVTSGGINGTCEAPDRSFETDVFLYADWITNELDDCATVSPTGQDLRILLSTDGELGRETAEARFQVVAPAGTTKLRAALNGQLAGTDFDLYVRAGSPPSFTEYDCADLATSSFGACELTAARGTWHVLVRRTFGDGTFQLNVTALVDPTAQPTCSGDCDGDGVVSVEDLVSGVNIILEQAIASTCADLDGNSDGTVTVEELVVAVGNALRGCTQ